MALSNPLQGQFAASLGGIGGCMRNAFVRALCDLAAKDERIVLLTGDLGFKVFDEFKDRFPKRFFNVGVAEANMAGLAAGMSFEGRIPCIYSIASFLTMRAFEQIRNDIAFHRANVKIVGVGGGLSYGPNGPTHHALNDVALLRSLPEMSVLSPGDPIETTWAIQQSFKHQGPVYIRLGRAGEANVHSKNLDSSWGQANAITSEGDIALLSSGLILSQVHAASVLLSQQGHKIRLVSFPSVKPIDRNAIREIFKQSDYVITVEEHTLVGGFGAAVMEVAMEEQLGTEKMQMIGCPDQTIHMAGSHSYLQEQSGLSGVQIAQRVKKMISQRSYVNKP